MHCAMNVTARETRDQKQEHTELMMTLLTGGGRGAGNSNDNKTKARGVE